MHLDDGKKPLGIRVSGIVLDIGSAIVLFGSVADDGVEMPPAMSDER